MAFRTPFGSSAHVTTPSGHLLGIGMQDMHRLTPPIVTFQRPMPQDISYAAGLCRHFVARRSCQCTTVHDEHASVIVAQGNRITVQKAYKRASCFRDLDLYDEWLGTELNDDDNVWGPRD